MRRPKRGSEILSYSAILRVVGQYIERTGLGDVRILETDEGLILQGMVLHGEHAGERDTYQLTPEDILGMLDDAQSLRGRKI